jgi:hypothetical protein
VGGENLKVKRLLFGMNRFIEDYKEIFWQSFWQHLHDNFVLL